jgi:hypothetical protein
VAFIVAAVNLGMLAEVSGRMGPTQPRWRDRHAENRRAVEAALTRPELAVVDAEIDAYRRGVAAPVRPRVPLHPDDVFAATTAILGREPVRGG